MFSSILTEIALLFGLILLNGMFAMAELSIVAARRERLQPMIDDGNGGAGVALQMSQEHTLQIGRYLRGDAEKADSDEQHTRDAGQVI